jgi:LysR family transcriptional regulator, carnitine catabolism transcriptional activator
MDFTSRQLRGVLLVAQHQNFSRAAEALHITPSGLSLLVRELENQLGFRLFDRTTRQVVLTTHGRQLLPVLQRHLAGIDAATSSISQTALKGSLTISIGAGLMLAANVLPRAIGEFCRLRPGVSIDLCDGDMSMIIRKVKAGQLDVGFGYFEHAPGIRRLPFFRFSLMVIRPVSDAVARRTSTSWSALKRERLILQAPPAPLRLLIDHHLARAGVSHQGAIVLNRLDTIVGMVEAGQGIGIIPSFAQPVCRHRNVVMTPLVNPVVPVDFFQIRNRGRKLSPTVDEFTVFLQGYVARWAGSAGIP